MFVNSPENSEPFHQHVHLAEIRSTPLPSWGCVTWDTLIKVKLYKIPYGIFNEISNTCAKGKQTLSNRVLEKNLVWCVGTEGGSIEVDYSGWNGKLYLGGGTIGLKRQDEARLSTSLNKFDLHFTGIRERKRWGKLCYGICFASAVQDETRSRDWLGGCDRRR